MRILVIGELNSGFKKASEIACNKGAKVSFSSAIDEALDNIRSGKSAELILIDTKYDIAQLSKTFQAEHINIPIIACSTENNVTDAVSSIKNGAKEFLPLPPDEDLIAAILEAISKNKNNLIGSSRAMQEVLDIADRVAKSDANILITGQSGTGKEVLANYIHNQSLRADKNFIRINCAAIPDNLLESELFGHEKGAFTGAVERRIGKFEESNGGTLLLDEISEIDIRLQAKLLRAIQEQEIDRVGGTKPIKVDLRIIATSNRDLPTEVENGNFREDLYYRLNIITIELPALAEREEDIIQLAEYFLKKYSNNNKLACKPLSKKAKDYISDYPWPGNVRELENTMHRAVLLASGEEIEIENLLIKNKQEQFSEKTYIENTLKHCLGDANSAANILGISIASIKNKINKYSINN